MRRSRHTCALLVLAVLMMAVGATSCGGGSSANEPELVLVGFNVPNVAGIPLNQPLIFTFSTLIDPSSITPDTLRVVGVQGPFFETTVVDGNLVALLPRVPNFDDYSDAGFAPATVYSVDLAVFPAPATIRTPSGKPLLDAEGYQFTTVPTPAFIEPRRPFNHGLPPSAGGRSDDECCLQNPDNELYDGQCQFGSTVGGRLLCLKNEGPPRVIPDECSPMHNDEAVGTPSAVTEGYINLPALRVRLNEPLDPLTVVPYIPDPVKLGVNAQLWRVGTTDKEPLPFPQPTRINKPLIVQSLDSTEIILVAANEDELGNNQGGVLQGTYMINVLPSVTDLPGFPLVIADRPNPAIGGFEAINAMVENSGVVAPGYRYYFVTLKVPGTDLSINEQFGTNDLEWGDSLSGTSEPGVFWQSDIDTGDVQVPIPGTDEAAPEYTLEYSTAGVGQSTSADWNGAFRFFGLPSLQVNTDVESGAGRLRANFKPYAGTGADGVFESSGLGVSISLGSDPAQGNSVNGDGIYEFESFHLKAGDTLGVAGTRPLVILCRGDFQVDGIIRINGRDGGPGLDTENDPRYLNPGSISPAGDGGLPGAGGGAGAVGGDPLQLANANGNGGSGRPYRDIFALGSIDGGGGGLFGASPDQQGGGGGGLGTAGDAGQDAVGASAGNGGASTQGIFARPIADFAPDRCYSPNAAGSGGTGGGGGGVLDDDGSGGVTLGDDGGGGGGGAGGGLYVLCAGDIIVNGTIEALGGDGGNTYAVSDQIVDLGDDGDPGGEDGDADTVVGIVPGASPSGHGGPGGGGSGGGLFLMGANGVIVNATATLDVSGGAGGRSGLTDLNGGDGSPGKCVLSTLATGSVSVDGAATIVPSSTEHEYKPTVNLVSAGQSDWIDLSVPTNVFSAPFWTDNFPNLADVGLVIGIDYGVTVEYQGALDLAPVPGGDDAPATATGLSGWSSDVSALDGRRYIRYRWRFVLDDAYPAQEQQLPAILEFVIPFTRTGE